MMYDDDDDDDDKKQKQSCRAVLGLIFYTQLG